LVQLARRDKKLESSETKIAVGERWGEGKANEENSTSSEK
jgi:hypothetical protein